MFLAANTQAKCYTYPCHLSDDFVHLFYSHWLWLRIQNGRQAYLGADWIQLCTTLLPAFWCRQDSVRSNIRKYPQKGLHPIVCLGFPVLTCENTQGWDSGLYADSIMPVSAITLTFIYCFSFVFHFCFELCLPYRQSDSQKPCLAVGSDLFWRGLMIILWWNAL